MRKLILVTLLLFTSLTFANWQVKINPPNKAKSTWLGGDIATSTPLSKARILWLFGDTLIGKSDYPKRYPKDFLHNSVGIMHCKKNHCSKIKKYYKTPAIFFTKNPSYYYWPTAGIILGKRLYITAIKMRSGARLTNKQGTSVIAVSNPQQSPLIWNYNITDIYPIQKHTQLFAAIYREGRQLYLFGRCDNKACLGEISIRNLKKHRWKSIKIKTIKGLPPTPELSIKKDKQGYYTLILPLGKFDISLYRSNKLTGPWIDKGVIYKIPKPHKGLVAYAPKIHNGVFTYNTNIKIGAPLSDLYNKLKKEEYRSLYIPQFVQINLVRDRV